MASSPRYHLDLVPVFNSSVDADYNQIKADPERYFNGADTAWMMTSAALVFLMIPGVSLIHSGLSDRRSAVSLFRLPVLTCAVVGCQWFLFGYSLTFSSNTGSATWSFWGGGSGLALHDVSVRPVGIDPGPKIPELVYVFYQEMFACFTATLVSGAVFRKFHTIQFLLFIFLWTTVVYDPIARWGWDSQGWSRRNGALDFAGGTVVHISSGAAVAAMAVYFGIKVRLLDESQREAVRLAQLQKLPAHNVTYVILGTVLLWVGWFGFNGGSALGANARAVSACISTQTAACFGSVTSLTLFWIKKKPANQTEAFFSDQVSTTVFCDGAIVGLVAITPAAGYVPVYFAPVIAIVAALFVEILKTILYFIASTNERHTILDIIGLQYDLFQIAVVHAGGGFVGMFLTAFFNRAWVFKLDGFSLPPPNSDDHTLQLRRQLGDAVAGCAYSFFVTLALLFVLNLPKTLIRRGRQEAHELMPTDHVIQAGELQTYPSDREPHVNGNTATSV